ncbi:MAG: PilZ domain-containing protein [Bdellovibrionaceae bacterium]|nr:PilZ domain-containing protein [Bdellovibrio sp.]
MADEKPARSVTEFLVELPPVDSLLALQNAYSQKSTLYFKTEADEKVIACTIDSFVDRKVFLKLVQADIPVKVGVEVSIKFNLGTEIFFVKAPILKQGTLAYFDVDAKVIQLKRRKEPRYVVPKKWTQSASIISALPGIKPIACTIIDISATGIRFEVINSMHLNYKRDDRIKVKFQVHRRGEVEAEAIVRFFMNRLNHGTLLGLELLFNKEVQRERVSGIVDDIVGFEAASKT